MRLILEATQKLLKKRGLTASEQNLKRAYWRNIKRHSKPNRILFIECLADYLELNNLVE